jgi:hypothetical protein
MDRVCSTHGRDEKCTEKFGPKARRDEVIVRRRHRWEDNIRMDNRETVWEGVNWIHLAQDRNQ